MQQNGFMRLYHTIWNELIHFKPTEKLFLIYLMSKQNQYGDKPFFLSDKAIMADLGIIHRKSLYRIKKRVNLTPFVEYRPGKYRKSASIWYIKGVKSVLLPASKTTQQEYGRKNMEIRRGVVSQPTKEKPEIHIHTTVVNNNQKVANPVDTDKMHKDANRFLNEV